MTDLDSIEKRLDRIEKDNREDHLLILNKLDKFVRWPVFVLLIPIVLGSYGFAWAYGSFIVDKILKFHGG